MKQKILDKLLDYSRLRFRVRKTMRYDDVGDYFDTTIISYDMKNPVFNNAIMLHEFIEYSLIKSAGIPADMIDDFDTDDDAPDRHPQEYKLYMKYHRIANNVERHLIENLGFTWKEYQKAVYSEKVKVRSKKKPTAVTSPRRLKVR